MTRFAHLAAAALLAAAAQIAPAADSATPAVPVPYDPLASARALIAENKWVAAIKELERVNMPRSADWNNLMGYSHRKAKVPDLAAAERHYDAALKIDPKHRGALEYSGELYLQLGDVVRAEQRLGALAQTCGNCDEKKELESAIATFKSNGNKLATKQ
jgi:tetratricopeptide (TPR) repeat protein